MQIGIVGLGHVGTAMQEIFPEAYIYDEPKKFGTKGGLNLCDVAFICVPTPQAKDGSCDTSIIEEVISWAECDILCIRSTIPVGFTDEMCKKYNKKICFQPEYYGETVNHPLADLKYRNWITLGGEPEVANRIVQAYQTVYTSDVYINIVSSKTAELAKYMENCYLATKVTFCNEFYDFAKAVGVDYNQLRETWLLDPRIGRSHTFVYQDNRGFGGSCLPKDTSAFVKQAEEQNVPVELMKSVIEKNSSLYNKR
jgi:UDPglucose 6-dehydrogenase